ncbi:MAG: DUF6318 family protein [Kocuria sp.]|uniref:DUF6318 family protein n=1 Tax=Kocuria TaxID=57493 RepID=UPI0026DD5181|nr:DUF6318 family protein [Kocuria sp.]MDO4256628.1 DUF6318 family protein [Kocuria sp.]
MGIHDVAVRSRRATGVSAAVLAAVLLTGCTGGGNVPEETATASSNSLSPSHASASAESTANTGSDDTSTTTPAPSGSENPLPDDWRPQEPTVLATGQKIPNDYEPATLAHPARNVPKPVMPDEAKQETEAGAQAFLDYRLATQWYAFQTGDTSLIRSVTSPSCTRCSDQYSRIDENFSDSKWMAGGYETAEILPDSFVQRKSGEYTAPVHATSSGVIVFKDGKVDSRQRPYDSDSFLDASIVYTDGAWQYVTASPRGAL